VGCKSNKYTDYGGNISFKFEENSKEKQLIINDIGISIKEDDIIEYFK